MEKPFLLFQLVDASTLKKEVAEGVDLMVVRELTGGQCSLYIFIFVSNHSNIVLEQEFILESQGVLAKMRMARRLPLILKFILLMR